MPQLPYYQSMMKMNIILATDDNYVMPAGVMLTSLFENNKEEAISVHLLHGGIKDDNIRRLTDIAGKYGQTITFHRMDDALFRDFPVGESYQNSHVGSSMATYYRLFLTQVLPEDISKAIYLDCAMIVTGSLRDLWNTDLRGKAVGAVPDSYNNIPDHFNRLRYPMAKGYFNAGVLLVNLDYWRKHGVVTLFTDYVRRNAAVLNCHDQDVLNVVFQDAKAELPLRYNMLNEYWFDVRHNFISWEYERQIIEGQRNPAIVHFTCVPKPWYTNCRHPYKREFDRYRAMTVWAGMKDRRWLPLKFFLEKTFIKAVVMIGLRKPEYVVENRYIGFK